MSAAPQKAKPGAEQIDVVVSAVVPLNELVTRFEFKRTDGKDLPTFSGGAHTVVQMQDDDRTRLNPYSLMSDPADTSTYAISVRRDDEGRGGAEWNCLRVGHDVREHLHREHARRGQARFLIRESVDSGRGRSGGSRSRLGFGPCPSPGRGAARVERVRGPGAGWVHL